MNFININSRYNIAPWQISFVKEVLQANIQFPNHTLNLMDLFQKIPFYLVDEVAFNDVKRQAKNSERDIEFENHDNNEDIIENSIYPNNKRPINELLGFYVSKGRHDIPEIYLCLDAIIKNTRNDEELTFLIAKVIIHELAHAYMDASRANYGEKDEFYDWMEEAFANKMTIDHFLEYKKHNKYVIIDQYLSHNKGISPYNYVKDFILSQPDNYKLGYFLHKYNAHYEVLWSINKDIIKSKENEKDIWLTYVKSNIDSGNFDGETINKLTRLVCENQHTEVPETSE